MSAKTFQPYAGNQMLYPFLLAILLTWPFSSQAQGPFLTPTPAPDLLACVPVQVLDQQQVTIGTHTITFKRTAPPVFPVATATPMPQAIPVTNTTNPAKQTARRSGQTRTKAMVSSAQGSAAGDGQKLRQVLGLSATVYDHQFTEVRCYDGGVPTLRAYINIDFAYFTTVTTLETADTVYDLLFAWSNDTAASLVQAGQTPPNLSAFPAGRSSYQIIAGDANAQPDALAALNALCLYYDANSAQMVAAYNQRQAYNAAYQQWQAAHPPQTPNTVINYWPVKSQVYLPAGQ